MVVCHLLKREIRPRYRFEHTYMFIENSFDRDIFPSGESWSTSSCHRYFYTKNIFTARSTKKISFTRRSERVCKGESKAINSWEKITGTIGSSRKLGIWRCSSHSQRELIHKGIIYHIFYLYSCGRTSRTTELRETKWLQCWAWFLGASWESLSWWALSTTRFCISKNTIEIRSCEWVYEGRNIFSCEEISQRWRSTTWTSFVREIFWKNDRIDFFDVSDDVIVRIWGISITIDSHASHGSETFILFGGSDLHRNISLTQARKEGIEAIARHRDSFFLHDSLKWPKIPDVDFVEDPLTQRFTIEPRLWATTMSPKAGKCLIFIHSFFHEAVGNTASTFVDSTIKIKPRIYPDNSSISRKKRRNNSWKKKDERKKENTHKYSISLLYRKESKIAKVWKRKRNIYTWVLSYWKYLGVFILF